MKRNRIFIFCVLFSFLCIKVEMSAQWVQTIGPGGGSITCIAVCGDTLYVGTEGSCIFRSTNNGANWINIVKSEKPLDYSWSESSSMVAIDGKIFVKVNVRNLYFIENNGSNWDVRYIYFSSAQLAANFVKGKYWFVGALDNGLFRSQDDGKTWAWTNEGLTYRGVQAMTANDKFIFASTPFAGIFRSSNNGDNWIQINNGIPELDICALSVSDKYLFACARNGKIYRSAENGNYWELRNNLNFSAGFSMVSSGPIIIVYTKSGKIYRSKDNGDNWTDISTDIFTDILDEIAINGSNLYAGLKRYGFYHSKDNGDNWVEEDSGISNTGVRCFLSVGDTLFAGTTSDGLMQTTDNGESWKRGNFGIKGSYIISLAASDRTLFAGTVYKGIYRSTDNGGNWEEINNGIINKKYIYCILVNGSDIYAANEKDGVYRSTDNGNNWNLICTKPIMKDLPVYSLAAKGNNLLVGTSSRILLSSDAGLSWLTVREGLGVVSSIVTNDTLLFAGTANYGIYRSSDNGITWDRVNYGLKNFKIQSLVVKYPYIFASTEGGVFITKDNGDSWIEYDEGLSNLNCSLLAIHGNYLFVSNNDKIGVWKRPLADTIVSVNPPQPEFPENSRLSLNYPNPFSSSTTISYNMPYPAFVKLSVFNQMGQEVAVLVNGTIEEGEHKVEFEAGNLPSDIYFYRLQAGDYIETRKLILLK